MFATASLPSPLNDTAQIMIDSSVPTFSEGLDLRERSLGDDYFDSGHFNDIVGLVTACIKYSIQRRWLQLDMTHSHMQENWKNVYDGT